MSVTTRSINHLTAHEKEPRLPIRDPTKVANTLRGKQFEMEAPSVRRMRGHKLSPTCVVLSSDDTTAFSGSKDNSLLRWDVETGKRTTMLPQWKRAARGSVPQVKEHSKEVSRVEFQAPRVA